MERLENSVLVIDDDIKVTKLLNFVLSRAGFRVIEINDGFNACRWLLDNVPDIIICDILMPEMSGLEVLQYIKNMKHVKDVPVLALTCLVLTGYKEKFLQCGFDAYYTKPINNFKFAEEVKRFTRSYIDEEKIKKPALGGKPGYEKKQSGKHKKPAESPVSALDETEGTIKLPNFSLLKTK